MNAERFNPLALYSPTIASLNAAKAEIDVALAKEQKP